MLKFIRRIIDIALYIALGGIISVPIIFIASKASKEWNLIESINRLISYSEEDAIKSVQNSTLDEVTSINTIGQIFEHRKNKKKLEWHAFQSGNDRPTVIAHIEYSDQSNQMQSEYFLFILSEKTSTAKIVNIYRISDVEIGLNGVKFTYNEYGKDYVINLLKLHYFNNDKSSD